jgi:Zn-finger nucleic acid-binding protein
LFSTWSLCQSTRKTTPERGRIRLRIEKIPPRSRYDRYPMSMYRDAFEQCPRCGVELVDARSARGCPRCGGMWLSEAVLIEMVLEMLPPELFGEHVGAHLQFTPAFQPSTPIPCPACHESMSFETMHDIVVDRCAEHGIWFDPEELGLVLLRTSQPDRPSLVGTERSPRRIRGEPTRAVDDPAPADAPEIRFEIWFRDQVETVIVHRNVIKIGRLASAHVRIPDAAEASRMHAVIDITDGIVTIIDLGSTTGTWVNGQRVNKAELVSGDVLGIGGATVTVEIVKPGTYRRS